MSTGTEVAKHREWLFAAMKALSDERETSVYQMASEGAKLEAQRHAAGMSERNATCVLIYSSSSNVLQSTESVGARCVHRTQL